MSFSIHGIDPTPFQPLFALSDAELASRNIRRRIADDKPGYPCRVSLEDAEVGEELLLLPYRHHDAASPYRAEGPIYVRRDARVAAHFADQLPALLTTRLLSLRAYDVAGMLVTADVVPGLEAGALVTQRLRQSVAYIHVHFARTGCFACRIDPA